VIGEADDAQGADRLRSGATALLSMRGDVWAELAVARFLFPCFSLLRGV